MIMLFSVFFMDALKGSICKHLILLKSLFIMMTRVRVWESYGVLLFRLIHSTCASAQ